MLTHITPPYVYELYNNTFAAGGTFECDVIFVPAKPAEEPYMIRDRYGIFYRLNEPDGLLAKNQRIRCKFTTLSPNGYSMVRVDEGAKLPYFSPEEIAQTIGLRSFVSHYLLRLIRNTPELEPVLAEVKAKIRFGFSMLHILYCNSCPNGSHAPGYTGSTEPVEPCWRHSATVSYSCLKAQDT